MRARQLIEKITVLRHSLFAKNLMERLPSPLLPELWRDLVDGIARGSATGCSYLARGLAAMGQRQERPSCRAAARRRFVLFVVLKYRRCQAHATGAMTQRSRRRSFFERAMSVAWVAPLRALAGRSLRRRSLYVGLDTLDLLYAPWGTGGGAILKAIVRVTRRSRR